MARLPINLSRARFWTPKICQPVEIVVHILVNARHFTSARSDRNHAYLTAADGRADPEHDRIFVCSEAIQELRVSSPGASQLGYICTSYGQRVPAISFESVGVLCRDFQNHLPRDEVSIIFRVGRWSSSVQGWTCTPRARVTSTGCLGAARFMVSTPPGRAGGGDLVSVPADRVVALRGFGAREPLQEIAGGDDDEYVAAERLFDGSIVNCVDVGEI